MENKNRIDTVVNTAMKNINSLIDVNTVIGEPIIVDNENTLIPISTVTMGILSGGGEYGKCSVFTKKELPYSAGNGSIISIKPKGFLLKNKDNNFKYIAIEESNYEKLLDKASELINGITKEN